MTQQDQIHANKTPHRIHYIAEWAELRDVKQTQIVRALAVDKGTVSKWFGGRLPSEKYLEPLARILRTNGDDPDEPADITALFRHPVDDWLRRMFVNRNNEEIDRLRDLVKLAFPEKTGTNR